MANSSELIKIVVLGLGGGGSNAVNNMILDSVDTQIKFAVINTDAQDIEKSIAPNKILISTKNKKNEGLGAGAKPEVGTDAAENSLDAIRSVLEGADMVFVAAGLGGGTGSGAAHVVARLAKEEMGISTVAVVTRPFGWEGKKRSENAQRALEALNKTTDALIEIPNDKIVSASNKATSLTEAFKAADNVLKDGVLGITDLITNTGLINLDFADVQAIVNDAGRAHMGIGNYKSTGEEENAVLKALLRAIESPLLETNINGARRIMINYVSSEELSMLDISEANQMVYDLVDEDVNLIWGAATDDSLNEGEYKVTVIAADFSDTEAVVQEQPAAQPQSEIIHQVRPQFTQNAAETVQPSRLGNMIGSVGYSPTSTMTSVSSQPEKIEEPVATKTSAPSTLNKGFDTSRFKSLFGNKR